VGTGRGHLALQSRLSEGLERLRAAGGTIVGASGGAMQLRPNVSLFRLLTLSVDDVLSEWASHTAMGLGGF
jgi:hypothetical protein